MTGKPGKRMSTASTVTKVLGTCIMGILREYTTTKLPLSPSDILKALKNSFYRASPTGERINTSMPTIRKTLNDLYEFCQAYPAEFCRIYGGYIQKYHLAPGSSSSKQDFISDDEYPAAMPDAEMPPNTKSFYAFIPQLSPQELLLLQSSIETNPYISNSDTRKLTDHLCSMAPQTFRDISSVINFESSHSYIDDDSARLMTNTAQLIQYMQKNLQIEINYGKYEIKPGSQTIELTPTLLINNKLPRWQRLDPICVLEANGFHYLVAHTDKSKAVDDVISYRIDRIIEIRPYRDLLSHKEMQMSRELIEYRSSFSALEYLKSHPVMYSGKTDTIIMLVRSTAHFSPFNAMLDTFGKITVNEITASEARQYLKSTPEELLGRGEHWYHVRLKHAVEGTVLWARQHIDNVIIISPKEAVDKIVDTVSTGLSRYIS